MRNMVNIVMYYGTEEVCLMIISFHSLIYVQLAKTTVILKRRE